MRALKVPIILSILVVTIGFLQLPYGFYMILRIVLFGSCGYASYLLYENGNNGWTVMAILAVLYNPFIPVHLHEKAIWIVANIVTLGALYWADRRLQE